MAIPYGWPMRWMRRRGDRVTITTGKHAGHTGTVESNMYQKSVDYPDDLANGHHIMLQRGAGDGGVGAGEGVAATPPSPLWMVKLRQNRAGRVI